MKQLIYICDRCGLHAQEAGMVCLVEVTFGGDGAAKDSVSGIDLCRGCYSGLVSAIRECTRRKPK